MDLAPSEKNEAPQLVDSGTESITESPVADDESEHSEESTVCDIQIASRLKKHHQSSQNILDKSFSTDEDELATPLEPTPIENFLITAPNQDDMTSDGSGRSDIDDGIVEGDFLQAENQNQTETQENRDPEEIDACAENKEQIIDVLTDLVPLDRIPEDKPVETNQSKGNEESDHHYLPKQCRTSILRDHSFKSVYTKPKPRNVSFPADDSILASYHEPKGDFSWFISKEMPAEKILQVYEESCKKHKTIELDMIKSQIGEIKNNTNHSAALKLNSVKITPEVNETLEDLLKVTNFRTLVLHDCEFTSETITEFLNMLEFYESVCHFEVEMTFDDEDTWMYFCNACSNIKVLESLSFKKMVINETFMRSLLRAVNANPNITMLKFNSCVLIKLPSFYLIENLMVNRTIRELYLPSSGLYTKEADVLARFLVNNSHLKVLDISNNFIGDRGLESLAKGLCKQNTPGLGLSALNIFNNQLSERSGSLISVIIVECKNLHTFNIGYNNLTDTALICISESLEHTIALEGLGLQNTLLTCQGIYHLADAIQNNKSLQKINLKGNKAIQIKGLEKLCQALTNSKIYKIEIDENNRSCTDPEAYSQMVKKLFAICTVNKSLIDSMDEEIINISKVISRKMSLSCEPINNLFDPQVTFQMGTSKNSPMLSTMPSPTTKSRFQIVKVPETVLTSTAVPIPPPSCRQKSRFRVTRVLASPEDEYSIGRFANVRSSVSSNDSLDSLPALRADTDSE